MKLDALKQRAGMLIKKIFGDLNNYTDTLNKISFKPRMVFSSTGSEPFDSAWTYGKKMFLNLVDTMIEDLSLSFEEPISDEKLVAELNKKEIFIVHGHNKEMKETTARALEKLGLTPIILHEKPNIGRTIIQKFIDHSQVGFAIVLISADDIGYNKNDPNAKGKFRARQNVILELGFFLGKLGINRVLALVEEIENIEVPSDYNGVLFIPFDTEGKWKFSLVRELKTLNYDVDANLIL